MNEGGVSRECVLRHLLVFDIETVVDVNLCAEYFQCGCRDIKSCATKIADYHLASTNGRSSFPKQLFHQVVAVAFVCCSVERSSEGEQLTFRWIRSHGLDDMKTEGDLVGNFFAVLEHGVQRNRPYHLVSFNGRGFDIPVLQYRAMKYGIPYSKFNPEDRSGYQNRYHLAGHFDLLDVLSNFGGASRNMKLDEFCCLCGFPGKTGVDGSSVLDMYLSGKKKEIREYCEMDVLNTLLLYLRHRLCMKGITKDAYNKVIQEIVLFLESKQSQGPHYELFYEAWMRRCRGEPKLSAG